jgi:dTDP-4-amino-4,6-dideoxygalactose transaminase
MVDLRQQYQSIKEEVQTALNNTLESTAFIMGPNVQSFENEVAEYLDCKHALGCASGTDALHLALRALDIQPGDEVITPSFTFAATAEAICYVGATPVFVDIDPDTLNLDAQCVENAITQNTKAIIAVHLFGLPANIDAIRASIGNRSIYLIEDCAQSFGASYKNKKTGSLGDIGCFSFFPSKNLGCYGDGGMVTTSDDELADKLKLLRNHGSPVRYEHAIIGYNSRLDEMQAAILRVKLKYIDQYNQARNNAANTYNEYLGQLNIKTPVQNDESSHVFHQYTLSDSRRSTISTALQENNIASAIYYPKGLHAQDAFRDISINHGLPVTEHISENCLSLPMYPELEPHQIETITHVIEQAIEK